MPVEEPSEYDLWSEVGPKVHWPETNEDQMATLGRSWTDVGAPFLYAGTSLNEENSLGGAWQDDAGRKYVSTLTALRGQAFDAGGEMKRLGGLAKAFGEDVRYTKDSIAGMIAQNDRVYQSMTTFLFFPDSAARSAFAGRVAGAINQFTDLMAQRIAARGSRGQELPRPAFVPGDSAAAAEPPIPPDGTRPGQKPPRPERAPEVRVDDKQFGKKIGKHAEDYGLDPADPASRDWLRSHIDDIAARPDEVRQGDWNPTRGGGSDYFFFRSGADVVVSRNDGTFVTLLKDGAGNGWFQGARGVQ